MWHWIGRSLFADAEQRNAIGAFRGVNYDANAYYRSELNCVMFTRVSHFCRVCAGAIDEVIDEYSRPGKAGNVRPSSPLADR